MAFAPDTSTYLLVGGDPALPNSRILIANNNLQFFNNGTEFILQPTLNLASITTVNLPGMIAYTGATFESRTLMSDGTISITDPNGTLGNPSFAIVPGTSNQLVGASANGNAIVGARPTINFVQGPSTGVSVSDNVINNRLDVTISANALSINASVFLASSVDGNSFNLGNLTTGLVKINVAGGIATPSTAISGTDYLLPTATLNQIGALSPTPNGKIITTSGGVWTALGAGTAGFRLTSNGPGMPLSWQVSSAAATATFLTQTALDLPANGINLGAANAKLGIGLTSPFANLDVLSDGGAGGYPLRIVTSGNTLPTLYNLRSWVNGDINSIVDFRTSRGTQATPSSTLDQDTLVRIQAGGNFALTSTEDNVGISFIATQDFTVTAQGTAILFSTTVRDSTELQTRMTIADNGNVGIGTTTPQSRLSMFAAGLPSGSPLNIITDNGGSSLPAIIALEAYVGTPTFPDPATGNIIFSSTARGDFAIPSPLLANDELFGFGAAGRGTTMMGNDVVDIRFIATQNFTDAAQGTKIQFSVTPNGANVSVPRMTLDQSGFLGIGTITPTVALDVVGVIHATGILSTGGIQSNSEFNVGGFTVINSLRELVNIATISCTGILSTGGIQSNSEFNIGGTTVIDASRNIISNSVKATGFPTILGNGAYIGWNRVAGLGATTFANQLGTGSTGGWEWVAYDNANVLQGQRMSLTQAGTLNIGDISSSGNINLTTGNFQINGTTVIDSSRNLTNIVNITSSGTLFIDTITRSGTLTPLKLNAGGDIEFRSGGNIGTANLSLESDGTLILTNTFYAGTLNSLSPISGLLIGSGNVALTNGDFTITGTGEIRSSSGALNLKGFTNIDFYANNGAPGPVAMRLDTTAQLTLFSGGTVALRLNASDGATKPTTTTWQLNSDQRIKTNIIDVETALPLINALKPRKYKYTAEHIAVHTDQQGNSAYKTDKLYYGFIADEVEQVLSCCVDVSNDSSGEHQNLKTFNIHNILILLPKAIQELSAENVSLRADIVALQAAVAALGGL